MGEDEKEMEEGPCALVHRERGAGLPGVGAGPQARHGRTSSGWTNHLVPSPSRGNDAQASCPDQGFADLSPWKRSEASFGSLYGPCEIHN